MPINWIIESFKWRFLINKIEEIKILTAIKAVFSGVTFSVFTPNRIGELAGRVFILKPENRVKAIFATGLSSFSQLLVTIVIGLFSLIVLISFYPEKARFIPSEYIKYLPILSIILLSLLIYFYFKIKLVVSFLAKFKFMAKVKEYILIIKKYSPIELFILLIFSSLRYSVFIIQFYFLLKFFLVEISFFNTFLGVSLMYLAMSAVPTFALSEIGVRGSVALIFIGIFSTQTAGILTASILLWVINLALPAIIGSVLFYRTKL